MIEMICDWHEVLWWFQGAMCGSHLRWGAYEDMVNKVWPQCSDKERKAMHTVMMRDFGTYWRPDGWRYDDGGAAAEQRPAEKDAGGAFAEDEPCGEPQGTGAVCCGDGKPCGEPQGTGAAGREVVCYDDGSWKDEKQLFDTTAWMYFRRVLACFCPDNQYLVTMQYKGRLSTEKAEASMPNSRVVTHDKRRKIMQVRAYLFGGQYWAGWRRYCDPSFIQKVEKMSVRETTG